MVLHKLIITKIEVLFKNTLSSYVFDYTKDSSAKANFAILTYKPNHP